MRNLLIVLATLCVALAVYLWSENVVRVSVKEPQYSGSTQRALGRVGPEFKDMEQAKAMLEFMAESPNMNQYSLTFVQNEVLCLLDCDLNEKLISRIQEHPDGYSLAERWKKDVRARLDSAAKGDGFRIPPQAGVKGASGGRGE